jgi:hypothetical protein
VTSRPDHLEALVRQIQSALRKPWPEGYVLKIVGGLPTWAAPAAPSAGGPAARIGISGSVAQADLFPRIPFNTLYYDTGSMYDPGQPGKLFAPVDGVYEVNVFFMPTVNPAPPHLYVNVKHQPGADLRVIHGFKVTYSPELYMQCHGQTGYGMAAGDYVEVSPAGWTTESVTLASPVGWFPFAWLELARIG